MRFLERKRIAVLLLMVMCVLSVSCFPVSTTESSQQDLILSPTFTKTRQPTETFVSTITPAGTESPLPTPTSTLTASATIPAPVQVTNTSVPIISPTKTKSKHSAPTVTLTSTPTPTVTPIVTPTLTPTLTLTAQFCPPPTPEPLWVNPVTSPTDQVSQIITVYIGYGEEVTITTESGVFTVTGSFNAYSNPALVEITLLSNTIHHLSVTAKVMAENGNCIYAYTLSTTNDKNGDPLTIVQGQATP
jgi:hypothetical protein